MPIRAYLKERGRKVDEELARVLDLRAGPFQVLTDSMRYSVTAGGKRVRPILALAACEAVGGRSEDAMPLACAMEMIHTFTLIHDDLPCMDNDDFRRGRPTNHKVFGEAQALLAGCSLLTLAFEILCRPSKGVPAERSLRAMTVVAKASGWEGVMGGQSLDMESTGKGADLDRVHMICRYKTATLISASVVAGAIIGGGSEDRIRAMEKYGGAIGLAFQVADDVLNVEGNAAALGKGTGTDADAGKTTFATVLGSEGAKKYAHQLVEDALAALSSFGNEADHLRAIARYIVDRDR